jgi:subfamily B ATP-binding cassette protein MsbA
VISRQDLRYVRALGSFVRPYWVALAAASLVSVFTATLTTIQPLVLAPAIDLINRSGAAPAASWSALTLDNVGPTLLALLGRSAAGTWGVIATVIGAYVGLVAVTSAIGFANQLLLTNVRIRIFRSIQERVYQHVLTLSMSHFVRQRTGDLASRLMNDAFEASQGVDALVRGLFQAVLQLAVYGVLLLRTDAWLTLGVLAVFALHLGITRVLRAGIRRLVVDQFDLFARLTSFVHEVVLSIRVVKSFGAERFEVARFVDTARKLERVFLKGGIFKYIENPLREVADAVGLGVVLLLAVAALSAGRLSVAGLVLFVVLARQALQPVSQVGATLLSFQAVLGASRRLLDLLDVRPSVIDGPRTAAPLRDAIRLERVSFAYEPGRPVIHDVSLDVPRGEMLAIVGPSGTGKSTLADLAVRLYDPTEGRVTYDGVDVREFTQESYRRNFGVVSQECLLFNATVRENIVYGRPVDESAMRRAARIAHADDFIGRLPDGYDTVVGDRGIRLSGGQRQRIAIARAIYGTPDVLILDEATSALDTESERQVQAALDEIVRDVTAIVIAHRLSTVVRADRIVVLVEGRIEAIGSHDELLVRSPIYRRLCDAQFGEAYSSHGGQVR